MLSKFYFYCNNEIDRTDTFDFSFLEQKLKEIYSKDVAVEKIHPGGTLGIFYQAAVDGKKKFIKTHMKGEMYHRNLIKEIVCMKKLYGDVLDISSFDLYLNGSDKRFMIMDYFDEQQDKTYGMNFVRSIIQNYVPQLNAVQPDLVNYNVDDLYHAAVKSYEIMGKAGLLSLDLSAWCKKALKRISGYGSYDRVLSHGDLSNVNIMPWKNLTIVIDWEDVLFAYPEYDLLYWLTFYSQRRYYNGNLFRDIGVSEQYGKDIMVLVLLIKSYISYMNKSYKKNKLSIDSRINEVVYM